MPAESLQLAIYDVSDDTERSRVEGVCSTFGFRVQKSAFECRLSRSAKNRLLQALADTGLSTGHVCLYRVAPGAKRSVVGQVPASPDPETQGSWIV